MQAPALYRLFQDKAGLLEAVAARGFELYMASKDETAHIDNPVNFLRARWERHVKFGLTHPELYLLMYADPHPALEKHASACSHRLLRSHMWRIAATGRLRVSEQDAAYLFHAASCGVVVTLLCLHPDQRNLSLSTTAREAALASILNEHTYEGESAIASAATTLTAFLRDGEKPTLTSAESMLLVEWLGRLAKH